MATARSLFVTLVTVLVLSGAVTAVPAPRDQPTDSTPPVRVFVDETLDVSSVQLTGGGTVGSGRVTLVGVAGTASGTSETLEDPRAADFGGFETGSYDLTADSDDEPEFVVTEPRVTSVVVENQNGANVTNGWEPTGESLTVTVEYNFAVADRLDLTVESPDGLDVTDAVTSSDRFTTSGDTVNLDLSDEPEGTFRITAEGSDLDRASRTVTVRTGPRRTATPLPTTSERPPVTATATATPTATVTGPLTEAPTETPTEITGPPTTSTPTTPATGQPTTASETTATTTPGFHGRLVLVALVVLSFYLVRRRA